MAAHTGLPWILTTGDPVFQPRATVADSRDSLPLWLAHLRVGPVNRVDGQSGWLIPSEAILGYGAQTRFRLKQHADTVQEPSETVPAFHSERLRAVQLSIAGRPLGGEIQAAVRPTPL